MTSPERGAQSPMRSLADRLEARNSGGRPSGDVIYGLGQVPSAAGGRHGTPRSSDSSPALPTHLTAQDIASATSKPLAQSLSALMERMVSPLQQMQLAAQSQLDQLQREMTDRLRSLEQRVGVLESPESSHDEDTTAQQIEEALAGVHEQLASRVEDTLERRDYSGEMSAMQARLDASLASSQEGLGMERQEREAQVELINDALSVIDDRLGSSEEADTAIKALEAKADSMWASVQSALDARVDGAQERLKALEANTDSMWATVQSAFDARVDGAEERLDVLSTRMDTVQRVDVCKLAQGVNDLWAAQAAAGQSQSVLEEHTSASLLALEANLVDLSPRLDEAEANIVDLSPRLEEAEANVDRALTTAGESVDGAEEHAKAARTELEASARELQDAQASLRAWCLTQLEEQRSALSDEASSTHAAVERELGNLAEQRASLQRELAEVQTAVRTIVGEQAEVVQFLAS